ncbi:MULTISPECIES: hypothetical protein [Streptomyces]|uniref:hypothetical protein n=1 Tax=Streptomyces TaxID=1883 RepID=UPI00163C61DF|nr:MULTISPECIES: hypothetical protein [Streptomyces]MBC2874325.1 hypothetical protein [Streptomyces sp. TYQ1024]UBI40360.1 hypothetical protein K7I03_30525 [Streptomyces mobaraensis]UKW32940.1 hypothetical protein MCU78_30440 [Streptomyces sp. TYQ1024]
MTHPNDMSEREYLGLFAKRPGMYLGPPSLAGVTAFLAGYDHAAQRYGGPGLTGWREWLTAHHQAGANLVWQAQIRRIALPGWHGGEDLTPDQEAHVLRVLFELLDAFLAEREAAAPGS